MKKVSFIWLWLITAALLPGTAAAQPSQSEYLDAIGVAELLAINPELTGRLTSVGLVELCEPSSPNQPCYAFLPNFEHRAFSQLDMQGLYYYDNPHRPACYSRHASMIAGILFGYDPHGYVDDLGEFFYRGIIPQAGAHVYETNWFIYKQAANISSPTLNDDVLSISWGTDAKDRVTMWWQWGIDALVERDSCVVVAGCGNGQNGFTSISKPSWGYNVISVGTARGLGPFPASLHYAGPPISQTSSFGPTDDGRCKPDVIACGFNIGPSADSATDYCHDKLSKSFSSFAAPQVAGVAALLIDAARLYMIPNGDDPRVVKALILNGANKLLGWHKGLVDPNDDPAVPLDYQQGAGLVNALNSYEQLIAGPYNADSEQGNIGWDFNRLSLDPNHSESEKMYFMPDKLLAGEHFRATLCWFLGYEKKGIFRPMQLHNLRLELWSLDEQGHLATLLDYSDSSVDNLEHIDYQSQKEQHIALVVKAPGNELSTGYETFGLAYCREPFNWQGDQLAGDMNLDGVVNEDDITVLLRAWRDAKVNNLQPTRTYLPGDINFDSLINMADLELLLEQWRQQSPWHQPY